MALFCDLQNFSLRICERLALMTQLRMPYGELEAMADEIADSVAHKARAVSRLRSRAARARSRSRGGAGGNRGPNRDDDPPIAVAA